MSEVDTTPRSRRAVLAAAFGAAAASVASALGRPVPTRAASGDVFYSGKADNMASTVTGLQATSALAFSVTGSTSRAIEATAITSAVKGATSGVGSTAIEGNSNGATGGGIGVHGLSKGPSGAGVKGYSTANSAGVMGVSMTSVSIAPTPPVKTGVYGFATQADGRGVFGNNSAGTGVVGTASTGTGVYGFAGEGTGVRGSTIDGTGVEASAPASATALRVSGRATFSRSGRAAVPANKRYVDVTPGGGLAPTTLVVATLETYRSDTWVTVARKNYPSAGVVRIYLNKIPSTTSSTTIGWIAIN